MTAVILLVLSTAVVVALVAYDRARCESARLRLLVELSGLLQVTTTVAEASELVPVFGRHLFPAMTGTLRLRASSCETMEEVAFWGDPLRATGADLCIPIVAAGETAGALTLRVPPNGSFAAGTEFFAHAFADQIALALGSLQQQEALRTRAVRDALTGLFNRRYLEECLRRELATSACNETQVGVMIVDVDHFKRFNDTYGHGGGDALLQQFARGMQSVAGENDIVCRYGGEEFVIVLPDTTTEALHACAERLRDYARELHVHRDGHVLGGVTISSGIAIYPHHATTAEGLIAAADRALYAAKTAGRDRVASPPPQVVGRDAA
jgi:diguanylate cyclase (GGDEF)-like protein